MHRTIVHYLSWQERAQFVTISIVHSFDKLGGLHFGCVSIILIALNPVNSAWISQYVMQGSKGSIVWSRRNKQGQLISLDYMVF